MLHRRIPAFISAFTVLSLLLTSSCKGPEGSDGPTGPAGPQGNVGAQGPIGPAGLSGVEVVRSTLTPIGTGSIVSSVVVCPAGKVAIGGGFQSLTAYTMYATASYPDQSNHQWWHISVYNPTTATGTATLYAVCAVAN